MNFVRKTLDFKKSENNLYTVCCSLKQPQQKISRCFLLPACEVTIGGSKSVENVSFNSAPKELQSDTLTGCST